MLSDSAGRAPRIARLVRQRGAIDDYVEGLNRSIVAARDAG